MIELILGGARSGKSAFAERQADLWCREVPGRQVIYVATGEAGDGEMQHRIAHHRARRPPAWGLIEAPLDLADALRSASRADTLLLVDCLTLFLSNLLFKGEAAAQAEAGLPVCCAVFDQQIQALLSILPDLPGPVILVSNEVGCGIVPMGAVSRLFADEQGRLNQRVAALADCATLVAAGLPLLLKGRQ